MIPVAIVGLGQIGSRFDEDSKRKVVSSHAGAYLHFSEKIKIVAACDIDENNLKSFQHRCPDVPVFSALPTMLKAVPIDVLSICTPHEFHTQHVLTTLEFITPKVIWCEKPMALSVEDAEAMVRHCGNANTALIVHHSRRWFSTFTQAKNWLDQGKIGQLRSIRVSAPNRFWAIGSHMVDLMLFYGGVPKNISVLERPDLVEDQEPSYDLMLQFDKHVVGHLITVGFKYELILEVDLIGSEGRILVTENGGCCVYLPYEESLRYAHYKELNETKKESVTPIENESTLLAIVQQIIEYCEGARSSFPCEGQDGLQVIKIMDQVKNYTKNR
ncbi:Gfo/Idh/MocA family oxidoreductase [Deltaproteobacteria bacterium TL4]